MGKQLGERLRGNFPHLLAIFKKKKKILSSKKHLCLRSELQRVFFFSQANLAKEIYI